MPSRRRRSLGGGLGDDGLERVGAAEITAAARAAAASTTEDEAEITRSDGVNVAILMALSEALDGRI